MASSTSGTSVAVFTCLCFFFLTFADQQQITVKTGDNVTLQCHHRGGDIQLLEWRRLNPEEDVFVCRHGKNDCSTPHPSFKNRVELRDPEMKDRDVSVILNNVTINDTGTYECYVRNSSTKPPPQLLNTTRLTVTDSDQQQITVKTGDNVTLQCHHRGGDIELLEWRRQDLKDENVFVWKCGKKYCTSHPSFKDRVELKDPEMKDGNVSVILKNVNINDTGPYGCYVRNSNTKPPQLLNTTKLTVTDSDQQQITVKTGDDVTLQCLDHRGGDIELLEWRRQNLEKDVFVCRYGKNDCSTSHPSFKDRVELRDPETKDGDVSVILKNVTINDTGTYECYVRNNKTKPPPQSIANVTLTVTDSGAAERGGDKYGGNKDGGNKDGGNKDKGDKDGGDKDGGNKDGGDKDGGDKDGGDKHRHLKLVLTVFVSVILVGIVGIVCVIHRKCNGHFKKNSDVSLPDEAADQEPT